MSHPLSRRRFLHHSLAGSAVVTLPGFLANCAGRTSKDGLSTHLATPLPENPFLTWFAIDEATIRKVMAALTEYGADHADLYFQYNRQNNIVFQDGIIARAYTDEEQGVGLRMVVGDQVGYAYTEDLSLPAMLAAAKTAAAIAQGGAKVGPQQLQFAKSPQYYALNVPFHDTGVERKLPLIKRVAELAKQGDPAISNVTITWSDNEERVMLVDLQGNISTDMRPMSRLWVQVNATKNGQTLSNSSNLAGRRGLDWYTEERLVQVAKEAVDRTMVLFDARQPPAGEMPVVLAAGASGILLHEAIGHGMEADFNRKNVSIYADMIGKKIAPDFVTIVDDGTVENERGALNVDDEGTPCERTVLVENGVLASYLHDRISAKHYGLARSTGSGRRESFRYAPMPRMRCTYMLNGPHSRDEIIASVQKGIIAETFTNGQVQIGAGDFTFYIKNGWLIENGKITAPIKDTNIIGNGPKALERVTMAAADSKLDTGGWTCGKDGQGVPVSQGLPTVLVSKMTVGGQHA